jgi:hypothetical protein
VFVILYLINAKLIISYFVDWVCWPLAVLDGSIDRLNSQMEAANRSTDPIPPFKYVGYKYIHPNLSENHYRYMDIIF